VTIVTEVFVFKKTDKANISVGTYFDTHVLYFNGKNIKDYIFKDPDDLLETINTTTKEFESNIEELVIYDIEFDYHNLNEDDFMGYDDDDFDDEIVFDDEFDDQYDFDVDEDDIADDDLAIIESLADDDDFD